jgi:hypothetical protein
VSISFTQSAIRCRGMWEKVGSMPERIRAVLVHHHMHKMWLLI